jgi:CelD/BcsL family acetyltransferase involved in cellulose biosynthesis
MACFQQEITRYRQLGCCGKSTCLHPLMVPANDWLKIVLVWPKPGLWFSRVQTLEISHQIFHRKSAGGLDMHVQCIRQLDELQPQAACWDHLAGDCPFRGWSWLSTWWKHYGSYQSDPPVDCETSPRRELYVLLVFDQPPHREQRVPYSQGNRSNSTEDHTRGQTLVAIAPCYLERTITRGRVLRLLGDGEVCSDHLSLLVDPKLANQNQVLAALVGYLGQNVDDWDLLEFSGVEADDTVLTQLLLMMEKQDCLVRRTDGLQRWSALLPESWELFLAQLSKSHRKQLRRLQRRVLETDRVDWHLAETVSQLEIAWDRLVDLHQRRRNSLGQPGCFASPRFANFHRDVAERLLAEEKLQLSWLELDGEPVAAEYVLSGLSSCYAYQSGLAPERIEESPGQLSLICAIRQAIDSGHRRFDFLRGDEPYKAHWRAEPHATLHVQVVPPRVGARWRYQSWSQVQQAGRWMRELVASG